MTATRILALTVVLTAMLGLGGCPQPGGGGSSSGDVIDLFGTDAETGKQGLLRITLANPVANATTVNLASSHPDVAEVPATASVPAGSALVQVSYEGKSVGGATITASVNGSFQTDLVRVLPEVRLTSVSSGSTTLEVGAATTVSASISATTPEDVEIDLNNSNDAVLDVPASLTIPPFSSSASQNVVGMSAGFTTVSASLGGATDARTIRVVEMAEMSGLSVSRRIEVGAQVEMSLNSNAILANDEEVAIGQSVAGIVDVPASATIRAGTSSTSATVVGVAAGTTTLSGSFNGTMREDVVTVVEQAKLFSFGSLSTATSLGENLSLTVNLDAVVAEPTVITLETNNNGVVDLPLTATVLPGSSSVNVPVFAVGVGSAIVEAALNGESLSRQVSVADTVRPTSISAPSRLLVGDIDSLTVNVDRTANATTEVMMTSSNPAVIEVPASLFIVAGDNNTPSIAIEALSPGETTITAEIDGMRVLRVIQVLADLEIVSVSNLGRFQTGAHSNWSISLNAEATEDTEIQIDSSDPNVMALPASAVVRRGSSSVSVPVVAGTPGTTLLTATLNGKIEASPVFVVDEPVLSSISGSPTVIEQGGFGFVNLSADARAGANEPVMIANSDDAVVAIDNEDTLTQNGTFVGVAYEALTPGIATIEMTAFGQTLGIDIEVVAMAEVSSVSASSIEVGRSGTLRVNLSAAVAEDTTVVLSQTNAAALSIPATVLVPAGRSSATVQAEGLMNAMTTVTATANGTMAMTNVTPTP